MGDRAANRDTATATGARRIRPFADIRVLEFTTAIAGPTCGRYLAAFGAEVIRVETWRNPDIARLVPSGSIPPTVDMRIRGDTGPYATDWNSGKLSVGINTGAPEGRDIILKLIPQIDIVISNLAAPVLPSLGLGYDDLRAIKPDLIFVGLAGFGNTPSRYYDYRAWGPNQAPISGLDYLTGWSDLPPSGIGNFSYPDYSNGAISLVGVSAALRYRDLTGKGQFIDFSQYEATVALIGPIIMDFTANGRVQGRSGNRVPGVAPHGVYPAAGHERWVALACHDDEQWDMLCVVAEGQPFTTDERFRTLESRLRHEDALDEAIGAWTRQFKPRDLVYRLQEVGVPAGQVADQADLLLDPQLDARDWWQVVRHRRFGADVSHGITVHLSETPAELRLGTPCFGEHNDYVLEQLAGLSHEERQALAERGVIFEMVEPEQKFQRLSAEWMPFLVRSENWENPPEPPALPLVEQAGGRPSAAASAPSPDQGPLAGLRVLDLTDEIGAYQAKLMADLGADVVRVEPPLGETERNRSPFLGDVPQTGRSLTDAYFNTSKRSITLNLDTVEGRALLDQLAEGADVLLFSGLAERYDDLDLDGLLETHPRLVVSAVTPFGLTGPYRSWRGNDLIAWATGGGAYVTGHAERPPVAPAPAARLSYVLGSMFAFFGTMAALRARDGLGRGQRVDVSLQECTTLTALEAGATVFADDLIPRVRTGPRRPLTAPGGHYPTSDGFGAILAAMPAHWDAIADWIYEKTGNDAALDPALKGPPQARAGDAWMVVNLFTEELTQLYTKQELFEDGQRRGIPVTPVNDPGSVADDPQLAERDFWVEVDVDGQPVRAPGPPFRPSLTPWAIRRRPPAIGEHNAEVYHEIGLTNDEIIDLRNAGII